MWSVATETAFGEGQNSKESEDHNVSSSVVL